MCGCVIGDSYKVYVPWHGPHRAGPVRALCSAPVRRIVLDVGIMGCLVRGVEEGTLTACRADDKCRYVLCLLNNNAVSVVKCAECTVHQAQRAIPLISCSSSSVSLT